LKEVIFIAITDFILFPDTEDYISIHNIRDIKTNQQQLRGLSFAFIELPKFNQHDNKVGADKWCDFFKNAETHKSADTTDPIIQKAYETLEMTNWSKQA
jgi:predicted transposase/invertase (TIGR01784 family)